MELFHDKNYSQGFHLDLAVIFSAAIKDLKARAISLVVPSSYLCNITAPIP